MNTYTYILIYLSICAVVTIAIPAARNQWKDFIKSIPQKSKDVDLEAVADDISDGEVKLSSFKKWKNKIGLTIVYGISIVLFFVLTPPLLPWLIKDEKRRVQQEAKKAIKELDTNQREEIDNNLYYWKMGGGGCISCLDCGYSEDIISFIHGSSMHYFTNSGLQCQSCGKFHSIRNWKSSDKALCECGGLLEREKPIFCPKCKSKNMKYDMKYIT